MAQSNLKPRELTPEERRRIGDFVASFISRSDMLPGLFSVIESHVRRALTIEDKWNAERRDLGD